MVKDNGEVYGTGVFRSMGSPVPTIIKDIKNVSKVDIGSNFMVFLTKNGKIYIYGYMEGIVNNNILRLENSFNVIDVIAGDLYILILLSNGEVMGLGLNLHNRLGFGNIKNILNPTIIPNLENIILVTAYEEVSYFLTNEGNVLNIKGEPIKIHIESESIKSIIFRNNKLLIRDNNFKYFEIRGRKYKQIDKYGINNLSNIIDISIKKDGMLILDNNGDVYVTGNIPEILYKSIVNEKEYDTIKTPIKIEELNNIIYIYNDGYDWFFVDINKNLYVMGLNADGELGTKDNLERLKPTLNPNIKI